MLSKKKRKIEEVHKSTHYPPLEKNGNEYYSVEGLVNADCHINICVGGRESGKTTDIITTLMMYDAVKNGNKFIFVRNLQEEITQKKLVKYFNAIRYEAYPELACFNNIYVSVQKEIWIRKIGEDNQIIDEIQVGVAYSIEKALSNKSMTVERNMYNKLVIEEFANNYIKWYDYFDRYTALVSTFKRWHDDFKVYMFANKVNRNNQFFVSYEVGDISKHPLDEIHVHFIYSNPPIFDQNGNQKYTRVAVENVANLTNPTELLLGDGIQNNTSGDDFESQKHDLIDYKISRTEKARFYVVADYIIFKVVLMKNTKRQYWFEVNYSKNINKNDRVISKHYNASGRWTKGFIAKNSHEKKLFDYLLKERKILYHDDLCGTEFLREIDSL